MERDETVFDCAIIGGGIVGLATAYALGCRQPEARLVLLEKEGDFACHQTGRNSGVIHSGIYYKPGSFKARFARAGSRSMVEFCLEHELPHEICGKVIVATCERELPLLENLFQRGLQNELKVEKISAAQVREIEPFVRCLAGLRVPTTGIVSYRQVSAKYAELIEKQGGTIRLCTRVERIIERNGVRVLETTTGPVSARFIVNCAGLHSDRVARFSGVVPGVQIVPFRGEYFELVPQRRYLVKTLIYPVPNPAFPFLGVHFTRMIDGTVHAGPNAVLAFQREGYEKTDFKWADFVETMMFRGFWKLVRKHWWDGFREVYRSCSKRAFVRSLQRLIPEVQPSDLTPCQAGVRAQALFENGGLVDDFHIVAGRQSLHVCNAPSPAATASLEIGRHIADQVPPLKTSNSVSLTA